MKQNWRPEIQNDPVMAEMMADQQHGNRMKIATCISLYLMLAMVWLPGFTRAEVVVFDQIESQPKPRPIPPKPDDDWKKPEKKNVLDKKVPIPDPDPIDEEPTIEFDMPEVPDVPDIVAGDDWKPGLPDDVPEIINEPIRAGMEGVEPPVFTRRVQPDYPERAAKIRLQGYVIVQAVLRTDGTVDDIKVLRGLGKGKFGFEEEAIKALRKWEFIPGTYRGKPADITLTLRITFDLQ